MKFKKLFSVLCSFTMMISSIFCCKADPGSKRIVFLGAGGVGKTQIVNQWVGIYFSEYYESTMGVSFCFKCIDTDLKVSFWDAAGEEKYRSLVLPYVRSMDLAVIVVDLTNDKSINGVSEFINLVKGESPGAKILLVGNKADLIESKGLNLDQQLNKLRSKAREHGLNDDKDIIAVSAKSGCNINALENRTSEILKENASKIPTPNNSLTESTGDTSNIGTSSNKYSKGLIGAGLVALIAGTGLLIKKHFTSNDTQKNESL